MHGDMDMNGNLIEHPWDELCPRCVVPMEWRGESFYCGRCKTKMGCCEGA